MKITSDFSVAAEIFAAAWCNLDCKYCYIPKTDAILPEHKKIIEEIKQITPIIDRLKKVFGSDLEYLSHWGSEPTLTIKHFIPFYKVAIEEFPKLKTITMSSNFMSKTKVLDLVDFIASFNVYDKVFKFDLQISLDGPPWIMDKNRRLGSTDKIVENIVLFVTEINNLDLSEKIKIQTHFKPTITKDDFEILLDVGSLFNFYAFFNEVSTMIFNANSKNKVDHGYNSNPSIVCPDEYTTNHGIMFKQLNEKIYKLKNENKFRFITPELDYYHSFKKIMFSQKEFFTKHSMFLCSAGDSQFGVSDYLSPCHDNFYNNFDFIKDAYISDDDRLGSSRDLINMNTGRLELSKKYTEKISTLTPTKFNKYQYKLRAFQDFAKLKITYAVGIITEMVHTGQVSSCYKNKDMATLLAMFSLARHLCLTIQIKNTGNIHLIDSNYFKLFGNGLVESFLKRFYNEYPEYT